MTDFKKSITVLVFVFMAGLFAFVSTTEATDMFPKLQFIVGPHANDTAILAGQNTTLEATVQNASNHTFTTPLCVEDITAAKHLGCVPDVELEPGEKFTFYTHRTFDMMGTHYVKYTYLDPNGQWSEILDSRNQLDRAWFTVAN